MTIHQLPHLDIPTLATPLVIFTIISYVICTSPSHLISVSSDLPLSTLYSFALVCFVPISLAPVSVSLKTAYTAFILYFRSGFVVGPQLELVARYTRLPSHYLSGWLAGYLPISSALRFLCPTVQYICHRDVALRPHTPSPPIAAPFLPAHFWDFWAVLTTFHGPIPSTFYY